MFIARFDHSVDNVRLDCSEGIIEGFARVEDTPHSVFKTSRSLTPPEMKDPSSAEAVDEFVAFPDDHSVVIAGSLPMLIGLLERWNRTDNPMPSQWGEVTGGLDFRAPVFVLRRYDPENRLDTNSPHAKGWFGTGTADISQVSVTISAEAEPVLELRAQTREGDAAERWLRSTVGFMNADGVSYVHTRDEVRAKATIPPTLAGEAVLVLIAFSGPNFAI
ncbi:MAG: hypothetical protein AMXMBFR58_37650 [Phycisphaerae bacterium]|nr:hypothetical protein [Phycisphaerales bacterium]